jgi:hypothetical protein
MLGRREEKAWMQSVFYVMQYHRMLRWLIVSTVLMLALIVAIIYLVLFMPKPHFYGNTIDGKILAMPPEVSNGSH